MFDTMTMTKVLGAGCGALLVFLLGGWAADSLYSTTAAHHGEGEGQAYVIAVADSAPAAGAAEAGEVDFAALLAAADPAAGEKVFAKCKACHKLDGKDATGPHLNGVVGRNIAASAGYAYSDAMKANADKPWTPEHLDHFLASPKTDTPGTKMSFAGLPKAEDRANLIAYLQSVN